MNSKKVISSFFICYGLMKVNLFTKIWILKNFFVSLQKSKYWGGSKDGLIIWGLS